MEQWTPHPKQKPFIDAILDPEVDIAAMVSGRGGGKSSAASAAIKTLIYQNPEFRTNGKPYFDKTRCTQGVGWCVTIDNKQGRAAEEAFEKVMGMAEDGGVIVDHKPSQHAYLLWWPSRLNPKRTFRMEFHSAEREKGLRGRQVDFLWCDESAIFDEEIKIQEDGSTQRTSPSYLAALKTVLQTGGPVFHTTTPKGHNWFYDWIYLRSLSNPRIKVFAGITTDDNPHLSDKAKRMIRDQSPQSDWDQEVLGLFKTDPAGLVYHFDDKKCTFTPETLIKLPGSPGCPSKELTVDQLEGDILAGVDFGFSPDPFVYIWVKKWKKTNGEYRYFVMDMVYLTKLGVDQLVPHHIKTNPLERRVFARYADPSRNDSRDLMMRLGAPTSGAVNDWVYGHGITASYFERGDIWIAAHLKEAFIELSTYEWSKTIKNRPKPRQLDHFCDALRYVIATEETLNTTVRSGYSIGHDDGSVTVVDANGQKTITSARNVEVYDNEGIKEARKIATVQARWQRAIEEARARTKPIKDENSEHEE